MLAHQWAVEQHFSCVLTFSSEPVCVVIREELSNLNNKTIIQLLNIQNLLAHWCLGLPAAACEHK
jgi:hypothetical protein